MSAICMFVYWSGLKTGTGHLGLSAPGIPLFLIFGHHLLLSPPSRRGSRRVWFLVCKISH